MAEPARAASLKHLPSRGVSGPRPTQTGFCDRFNRFCAAHPCAQHWVL